MKRVSRRRGFFFNLGVADVIALLVGADQLPAVALGDLLRQELPPALGTRFRHRLVPEREVALRIIRAAVEDLPAARLAFHDLALVLRAQHARRLLLDVLALRIAGAGGELTEAALLDDEIAAAVGALLLEELIGLRGRDPL